MSFTRSQQAELQGNSAPPVVTAMVVHEPGPWFDEVLNSIVSQDYPAVRNIFFVTTPATTDPATKQVSQQLVNKIQTVLPNAIIRIVEGNPGFGPLINETQRIVEGDGGLFCVMHDDVALHPSALSQLVHELFVSNAAVVGPKLVEWENTAILKSVGFGIDRCGEVDTFIEPNERDQEQHDSIKDVFYISSACMLVRSDLFRELNGFCTEIPFFGEDLEFCWRAHLSGARVIIVPAAVARHREQFASRSPNIARNALTARHRARTVATLTWRFELLIVWLQMVLTSLVETFVGLFRGTFRASLLNLRASLSLLVDAAYILRRRRQVGPARRVRPSEISKLQIKGSARITRFIRRRQSFDSSDSSNSSNPSRLSPTTLVTESRKVSQESSTRESAIATLVVFALILVGSRGIISSGTRTIGELLPFDGGTNTPASLFEMFRSGWWSSGFGQAASNPTGIGILALLGYLLLGNLAALQTWMIVGSLFIGFFGMWRLCGAFFNSRARLVGATVYVALPLSYDAIARGRFSALLTIAALPWVFDLLRRAGGLQPALRVDPATNSLIDNSEKSIEIGISRRTQLIAGLVLIIGIVSAFAPALLIATLIGVVLWSVASMFGGTSLRTVGTMLAVGVIGVVGSLLINLPWSMHFVSGQWWQLLASDQLISERNLGLVALASMNFGSLSGASLVLAGYFCVACSLLIANSWRFVWALRSAFLVIGGLLLAILDDRGLLPFQMPEPTVLLALVACGLALASATCASVFSETSTKKYSDWRRSVAILVPVAVVIAILPTLLNVADGRWHQPASTVSQLFTQMPDNPPEGNYRILFVGESDLLPVSTNAITNKISYGVSDDGPVNIISHWAPQYSTMNSAADRALNILLDRHTVRLGRIVAPLAIRYIVVPLGSTPSASTTALVDSLSNQIDLRRLYFAKDLVIFENSAWLPIVSLLDEESSVASQKDGDPAFIMQQLHSIKPLFVDGNSVSNKVATSSFEGGTVHLSVPFDENWRLSIDGARLIPRAAFGATTGFDAPVKGVAELGFHTSSMRSLFLLIQGFVWFALLIIAANFSRFRSRARGVSGQAVRVIGDDTDKVLKLDRINRSNS